MRPIENFFTKSSVLIGKLTLPFNVQANNTKNDKPVKFISLPDFNGRMPKFKL